MVNCPVVGFQSDTCHTHPVLAFAAEFCHVGVLALEYVDKEVVPDLSGIVACDVEVQFHVEVAFADKQVATVHVFDRAVVHHRASKHRFAAFRLVGSAQCTVYYFDLLKIYSVLFARQRYENHFRALVAERCRQRACTKQPRIVCRRHDNAYLHRARTFAFERSLDVNALTHAVLEGSVLDFVKEP